MTALANKPKMRHGGVESVRAIWRIERSLTPDPDPQWLLHTRDHGHRMLLRVSTLPPMLLDIFPEGVTEVYADMRITLYADMTVLIENFQFVQSFRGELLWT